MAALATIEDVEARWRPLTATESAVAAAYLDQASALARQRTLVDTRLADEDYLDTWPDYPTVVVGVIADMVLRVMRNPEGKRSETIDDYSYTRDNAVSTGGLYLSDAEAALLNGVSASNAGAFSIRAVADPGYRTDVPELLDWS